jgi:L-fuconate dehydratase
MLASGLPSYTTSAGWLGYDDAKLAQLCHEVVDAGWNHVKLKVGRDIEQDVRRVGIAREILGPDRYLMLDANQVWSVDEALGNMARLAEFQPYWIEEPTSPDDVLGHARIAREIAPLRVATGEHVQNRIVFKQLLQAEAIGFCQIDACRLAGVNEVVAVLLLAAHFRVPVCPHAGGVGLCELVQHLSLFNYVAVTGSLDDVVVEYVDHLHEHFVDPVVMRAGKYVPPSRPGYSAQMHAESIARYRFPDGPEWAGGEQ